MKIAYFPNQTALQSEPVWQSFLEGCRQLGVEPMEGAKNADMAVIWSVLWNGRMRLNESIYNHYRNLGKPVFIIEVGSLDRGRTWKISANHITKEGIYGNTENLDTNRSKNLGIELKDIRNQRKDTILIVGQHERSLQWQKLPTARTWLEQKIREIRNYTARPIIFRPHPRCILGNLNNLGITVQRPNKIQNTYDKFDLDFNHYCVIGHNSGVGIQSVISGTPIICDETSLAYEMSGQTSKINEVFLPDRSAWFQKILHTEWTIEEMRQGIPQRRILSVLGH